MSHVTRTRTYKKTCESGVRVTCEQRQENRAWSWMRWLVLWWVDVGTRKCEECPDGSHPKDAIVEICCTAGAFGLTKKRSTGAGLVGALGDLFDAAPPVELSELFGPPPLAVGFAPLKECIRVDAEVLNALIENMEAAEDVMRTGERINQGRLETQQAALARLKSVKRNLNW